MFHSNLINNNRKPTLIDKELHIFANTSSQKI